MSNIFIMDWETPHQNGIPISVWRRLMVANEWNRIVTTRSYSIAITLLIMIGILEGLNCQLLAAPIPRAELIDVGKTYKVLRFAFTTFLWMILMVVEYFVTLLVWTMIGNPFLNFIDLAATANMSVLMLDTPTSGFYLHGRSVHAHADESMETLNQHMVQESEDRTGLRGLVANTDDQVFRIYLSNDFSYALRRQFAAVREKFSRKAVASAKQQNAASRIEIEAMGAFDSLNRDLRKFFESSEGAPKFTVEPATLPEKMLGWAPLVVQDSVLTPQGDIAWRNALLIGLEWTLSAMCMMLFAGIEMQTESPAIAAFVVFFVDALFVKLFKARTKSNLAKQAILDRHFILH
jgi:meckelin